MERVSGAIADLGLRIADLKRHRAWGMEHGEKQQADCSWQRAVWGCEMWDVRCERWHRAWSIGHREKQLAAGRRQPRDKARGRQAAKEQSIEIRRQRSERN